jgi:hypothetical protein
MRPHFLLQYTNTGNSGMLAFAFGLVPHSGVCLLHMSGKRQPLCSDTVVVHCQRGKHDSLTSFTVSVYKGQTLLEAGVRI